LVVKIETHAVLVQPLLTEKITGLRERTNTVGFIVHPDANRLQIKQAVEALLKVKVEKVNVLNIRGKVKRLGRFSGRRSDWKKAFVTLKKGEKIELYESA
jgi:large subunit ribosomal protein L23